MRIAITSCCKFRQVGRRHAWADLVEEQPRPDWFLLLGDNVYCPKWREWLLALGLSTARHALVRQYERLFRDPAFRALWNPARMLATWDDHDFGGDDVNGADRPHRRYRDATRQVFLEYLSGAVPHRGEVYCSLAVSPDLRIIMTDVRYYRSAPDSAGATLLGTAQEEWLLAELAQPERLKIVGSGSCLGFDTGKRYEQGWNLYPKWFAAFRAAVRRQHQAGRRVLFVAGDLHANRFVDHSRSGADTPLLEVISSGAGRRRHNLIPWSVPLRNYALLDLGASGVAVRLVGALAEHRWNGFVDLDSWHASPPSGAKF